MKRFGPLSRYLLKFFIVFAAGYLGSLMIIGLAAPGGYYNAFIDRHLDYVSWLKLSMLHCTGFILSFFKISTQVLPNFVIKFKGGRGVFIAMDCVGFGIYSFWIAFVAANRGKFNRKMFWILIGLFLLWFINVVRITLFLTAINKGWPMPLGIDHHTWFDIFAYALIGILIFCYHKSFTYNILKSGKKQ